ncbi:MAG: class I tRNA ligase family protein, partial [Gammaproteobacteria bacterium]
MKDNDKSYKDTLNLPHTDFPMKANLAQREVECLKHWEKMNLYTQLRQTRQGKKKYILHDGPPYAN